MTSEDAPILRAAVSALVLGAGRGERFGVLKAFAVLGGQTLLERAVDAVSELADEIIVGVHPDDMASARALLQGRDVVFAEGGTTRQETVGNLLERATNPFILVHETARPFVSMEVFTALLAAGLAHGAAASCLQASERDSVGLIKDGMMVEPLKRAEVVRAFSPTVVRRGILEKTYLAARANGWVEESTHSLVCRAGFPVRLIEGNPENRKITFPLDITLSGID